MPHNSRARENGGMETYGVTTNPILMPGNAEPWYSEFVTFIGIGVDRDTDTQLYGDATIASAMPV